MDSLETRRKMNVKAAIERKQLSKFIILYMSKYLSHASLKIKVGKVILLKPGPARWVDLRLEMAGVEKKIGKRKTR